MRAIKSLLSNHLALNYKLVNEKKLMAFCLFSTLCLFFSFTRVEAANETIKAGAFIVNMGEVPQTKAKALKPYGMIYDLVKNCYTPVKWVIATGKGKDGTDFTYNGTAYKGGTFIIEADYRTATVNARIAYWQTQGVVGVTTTSAVTVPVYTTIQAMPRWTLDKENGSIAQGFFVSAGIPEAAYGGSSSSGWKLPSELGCCDDLFVMPHADPEWSTHGSLYTWNLSCKGSIWLGCHAGSALEDMFNPSSPSEQTNFLAEKTGTASGSGHYSENALKLWGNHNDGTPPYTYAYHDDPVMQFMGTIDAATQNGSEQIFIPMAAGWRPTTLVGVYDPDHSQVISAAANHRAAILAYGRALGDDNRGFVMLEAAHDIDKSSIPANVAAQRAFFNFSFLSALSRAVIPIITAGGSSDTIYAGVGANYSLTLPGGLSLAGYTITWSSSCGGTFTPDANQQNVTFIPPAVTNPTSCFVYASISDACGRTFDNNSKIVVACSMAVTATSTNPACSGATGSISFAPTGATGPFTYNWSNGAATGSGTGTTISGLSAGTYNVTVSSSSGCSNSFSRTLTAPPPLSISAVPTPVSCYGMATGSIDATTTGGTSPYTYSWGDGVITEDRTNLAAGTYGVTVSDANGCTASTSTSITAPSVALSVTGTTSLPNCNGGSTRSINITATGGTTPYTYNWGSSITSEDRTSLAAGIYRVTVTDNNNCTATLSVTLSQPSPINLSLASTHPSCPPSAGSPLNNKSLSKNFKC